MRQYHSKKKDLDIEFYYYFSQGDRFTPDYEEIEVLNVTRNGVDVYDLIDLGDIEQEIKENLTEIFD
jgi:hypothetical protein